MTGPIEITGGKLIAATGVDGAGSILVSNTGVFGGSGIVSRAVTVQGGGTLSPGSSPGKMTFTNTLDLSNGGVFEWELTALNDAAAGAGIDYDQLVIDNGGGVVLGGTSTLKIDVSPLATIGPNSVDPFWNADHSWVAVDLVNSGVNPGDSDFGSVVNATFNHGFFSTSVAGGKVLINFTAAPVPEPASWLLTSIAAVLFIAFRRK